MTKTTHQGCNNHETRTVPSLPREESAEDSFGPVIFRYTRAQAIDDGNLRDVSRMAWEAGIRYATAITAALWSRYVRVPKGVDCQDEKAHLWNILNMYQFAVMQSSGGTQLMFKALVRNDNATAKLVTLKAICGPGDTQEPVLTIMLPDQDLD